MDSYLALEKMLLPAESGPRMAELAQVTHQLRARRRKGKQAPLEDTLHVLALSSLALMADAVISDSILGDLGLGTGPAASARFRAWLARLLADHLENGPR